MPMTPGGPGFPLIFKFPFSSTLIENSSADADNATVAKNHAIEVLMNECLRGFIMPCFWFDLGEPLQLSTEPQRRAPVVVVVGRFSTKSHKKASTILECQKMIGRAIIPPQSGVICHETPYLSSSQPPWTCLRPLEGFFLNQDFILFPEFGSVFACVGTPNS